MSESPATLDPTPSRRAAWLDSALCALAALPVLAVLIDSGDLFLWSVISLPVAIMVLSTLDPLDPLEEQRGDDPQARRRR